MRASRLSGPGVATAVAATDTAIWRMYRIEKGFKVLKELDYFEENDYKFSLFSTVSKVILCWCHFGCCSSDAGNNIIDALRCTQIFQSKGVAC